MRCTELVIRVRPEKIHFLKFILEGYDGLAVQSTIDPALGKIRLLCAPEVIEDLTHLLQVLEPIISPQKI
jgi:hypothetical protein